MNKFNFFIKNIFRPGFCIFTIALLSNIALHVFLIITDYHTIKQLIHFNLENIFWGTSAYYPLLPIIIMSAVLIAGSFFIWAILRKTPSQSTKPELLANNENIIQSVQEITKFIIQHINTYNTEIIQWVEEKKQKGEQAPKVVEQSTRMIAVTIQALTEKAFLIPYSDAYNSIESEDINYLVEKKIKNAKLHYTQISDSV